jgi:SAM-dependent methyltransferase
VLTVSFDRLGLQAGDRFLDLGCGGGRHAFEAVRRGAHVVGVDYDADGLPYVAKVLRELVAEGAPGTGRVLRGDATRLPFPDATFDRVIVSEVLEHIPADRAAIAEVVRITRPGGTIAVTVPRWLPELVCWALSDRYYDQPGGHIRIYRRGSLVEKLRDAGLEALGVDHVHGLHAPYWWLRCVDGPQKDPETEAHLPVRLYHKLLVWDIVRRPVATRLAERALDPVIGKSLVVYLRKPFVGEVADGAEATEVADDIDGTDDYGAPMRAQAAEVVA